MINANVYQYFSSHCNIHCIYNDKLSRYWTVKTSGVIVHTMRWKIDMGCCLLIYLVLIYGLILIFEFLFKINENFSFH